MKSEEASISIIIPNLNSPMVDKTIESVLSQKTDQSFELIIVGLDKWGLINKYSEVKFIDTIIPVGAAEARNIGIKASQGKLLLFIDSDCIAKEDWIGNLVNGIDEGWQVIGGGVQTPEEPFFLLVYNLSMFHAQLASQKRRLVKFLPTLNLAVDREVIEKVGLMDESLTRGQDVDWTTRMKLAGYDLLFKPDAKILHIPTRYDLETLRNYFHKSGYYMIKVRHRYPEIFQTTRLLNNTFMLRTFAPLIAAFTTFRIYFKSQEVRKHARTLPYIYLLKLSWCQGAADSLSTKE